MHPRTRKNQQESTRINKIVTLTCQEGATTVLGTEIIEACYKNCQESFEHSNTFLRVPEHNKNIQEHSTTYDEQTKNIQESKRNMQNFSKNWKLSKFLVYLAMVFGTFLTVGRGLYTAHTNIRLMKLCNNRNEVTENSLIKLKIGC